MDAAPWTDGLPLVYSVASGQDSVTIGRIMRKRWYLIGSCAVSFALTLSFHASGLGSRQRDPADPRHRTDMGDGVSVTSQLALTDGSLLRSWAIGTVIDLRPDGEQPDQPSSADMATMVRGQSMQFAYVPIPHGEVPAEAVQTLADTVRGARRPILLYCRSGNRAVRACSLVRASDPHGPGSDAILRMARAAGHPVDDLEAAIRQRIAARVSAEDGAGKEGVR